MKGARARPFTTSFRGLRGHSRRVASFEEPVKRLGEKVAGFIDLFWKGVLLVEQKSAGRDLVPRQGAGLDYFRASKEHELPRYLLVSDFRPSSYTTSRMTPESAFPFSSCPSL